MSALKWLMVVLTTLVLSAVVANKAIIAQGPLRDQPGAERPAPKEVRCDLYGDPLPPGAVARMGTMRLRHEPPGRLAIASSADGKLIATSGRRSVCVWDAGTRKLMWRTAENDIFGTFGSVRFSPDGKCLAAAGENALYLFDPYTGRLQRRLRPGRAGIRAFSPDARLLAIEVWIDERKSSVEVWHTASGKLVLDLKDRVLDVADACFTRDANTLLTRGQGGKLCRWNVATAMLQETMTLPKDPWRPVCFSADGLTLVLVSNRGDAVQLWDTTTGRERRRFPVDPASPRWGLALTPDGKTLATGGLGDSEDMVTVSLWNAETGQRIRRFPVPTLALEELHFLADGRTLLSWSNGPVVHLWDTANGRPHLSGPAHERSITGLQFTPDGRTLVSSSVDGTIRVWQTATGRQQHFLTGHGWYVTSVAVLPNGRAVLSAGPNGTLCLWDLGTGAELRTWGVYGKKPGAGSTYRVERLGLRDDGRTAASYTVGSEAGVKQSWIHVWDLATGRAILQRTVDIPRDTMMAFSPDLTTYTYISYVAPTLQGNDGAPPIQLAAHYHAMLKQVATGRVQRAWPHPDQDRNLQAFSPDGRMLATATLRFFVENGEYQHDRHTLHFWELATGKERLAIVCPESGYDHRFVALAFSPNGRILATARANQMIQLWDVRTGKELLRRSGYDAVAYCLAFTPDGQSLASGHDDSTVLVWDVSLSQKHKAQ